MPCQKNKIIKQKQYCDKFNKDYKMVHINNKKKKSHKERAACLLSYRASLNLQTFSHLVGEKWYLIVILLCIFPIMT